MRLREEKTKVRLTALTVRRSNRDKMYLSIFIVLSQELRPNFYHVINNFSQWKKKTPHRSMVFHNAQITFACENLN
jgi:hypothetical protein